MYQIRLEGSAIIEGKSVKISRKKHLDFLPSTHMSLTGFMVNPENSIFIDTVNVNNITKIITCKFYTSTSVAKTIADLAKAYGDDWLLLTPNDITISTNDEKWQLVFHKIHNEKLVLREGNVWIKEFENPELKIIYFDSEISAKKSIIYPTVIGEKVLLGEFVLVKLINGVKHHISLTPEVLPSEKTAIDKLEKIKDTFCNPELLTIERNSTEIKPYIAPLYYIISGMYNGEKCYYCQDGNFRLSRASVLHVETLANAKKITPVSYIDSWQITEVFAEVQYVICKTDPNGSKHYWGNVHWGKLYYAMTYTSKENAKLIMPLIDPAHGKVEIIEV